MGTPVSSDALDAIFRKARTQNKWLDRPVTNEQLFTLYDLMRWGPTSANSFPARMTFVVSPAAKERLIPLVFEGNREKVRTAPITAILGYDTKFYEWIPRLFPHRPQMRDMLAKNPAFAATTAFRNSSLQGAYLIIAARALGLDCGPMSGFDNEAVDQAFFPGGQIKSNFICAIGYGDPTGVLERLPRPEFREVCSIV
jgi:3-hydroxypropanoate dehydrogenase